VNGLFADGSPEDRELLGIRAVELAARQEKTAEQTIGALVVTVEKDRYALPLAAVREVVSEYRVTPVPCAPVAIRGVVNLRGEIVSVTDLAIVLGLRGEASVRPAPLVVVTDGSVTTALLVDSVAGIATVSQEELAPPLAVTDDAHAEAVSGSFTTDEGPVALLDTGALLLPVGVEG
jgi:purine-binding chemotaxis protein CheW